MRLLGNLVFAYLIFGLVSASPAQDPRSTEHQEGLRSNRPASFVLTNVKAVVAPGQTIEQAMIFIRDGKIESVKKAGSPIPAAFRELDLNGKTVYAGLIDAYTETSISDSALDSGAPYWNSNIRPQLSVAKHASLDSAASRSLRKSGVAARLVVPSGGIIKGNSALLHTGDGTLQANLIKSNVAQHARLTVERRFRSSEARPNRPSYPNSPMGAVALARQAMYDARWYRDANERVAANSNLPLPEPNDSLISLAPVINRDQALIIDSSNELYYLRAHRFANEFNLKAVIKGSGFEFRRLDDVANSGRSIILPVNFPTAPNVSSFESAINVSLETLMEWDLAPENPARLANAGVEFAFCSSGLDDQSKFLDNVRKAVERGLSREAALSALTITPAKIFGVSDKLGRIEKGQFANLLVTDGDLFDAKTKITETWVSGIRYRESEPPKLKLSGSWRLETKDEKGRPISFLVELESSPKSTSGTISIPESSKQPEPRKKQEPTRKKGSKKKPAKNKKPDSKPTEDEVKKIKLSKVGIQNNRLSAVYPSEKLDGNKGVSQFTFVFSDSLDIAEGFVTLPSGIRIPATLRRSTTKPAKEKTDEDSKKSKSEEPAPNKSESKKSATKASFAVNYPLGSFGRSEMASVEKVLIKNVTIWTCSDKGIIQNGSVLLLDGKIAEVGESLNIGPHKDVVVIDGKGMHLTPGIIDCHSHMASDGGINESGQAITAEVRIGDFINCNDINIYRQLAGGVTTSNILHGSANPIGGQNQVIKLRWGMNDEDMKFQEAPKGIKFALGENVKRSRDRESTRYPRTRMGVEQIFLDEFRAAHGYEQEWKRWNKTKEGLPPRRNLELDAIVEILNKDRWIHCHSYRQDEILALIRLLDGFKIQIGTFQHILEGYKVADAMKKHGAMGSAFADWWAYKFEVYDAIPYAGALMHNAGVVVSFNSDDRELARHLNHEAAKAVKYGGVPPEEALKFVTLNPAKQLRIDEYVGSIEPGKHADVVLWNGNPLSTMSRCEKTWVDGRRLFDRQQDQTQRKAFSDMKQKLIQKVLSSGESMNSLPGGRRPRPAEMWPNYDEFCRCKGAK